MRANISVIIPVYNHAATILRSVETLVGQTVAPTEIIIVDDGSTDNLDSVASSLLSLTQAAAIPLKIIRQENKGAAAARNRGFKDSRGEYVIFWDADTIAKPQLLEKMLAALQQNPGSSYAYSQFKFGWKTMRSHPFDPEVLKKINFVDTTSLVRRADFCGFDEKLKRFQDWDLWLSLLAQGKMGVFIPEVLFTKVTSGRQGMSSWVPRLMFKVPWKNKRVQAHEAAKRIVLEKHGLV